MSDVDARGVALTSDNDLVSGQELATPKARAEQKLVSLLEPAMAAAMRCMTLDARDVENMAQASAMRAQLSFAMSVIDGCRGIASEQGGRTTRNAAKILATVGGDAVTKELMRRYAAKQRTSERARIIEAVPAVSEVKQSTQVSVDDATRSTDDARLDDDTTGA